MDAKVIFGKLSTNRATLKKMMEQFRRQKQEGESFISPRPVPGVLQGGYVALLRLSEDSRNSQQFKSHKNFKPLAEEEYQRELASIKYSWEA